MISNFNSVVQQLNVDVRRSRYQRHVEFQKRSAMGNYLQDHKSTISVSWADAANYDLWFGANDDLLNVMLYGC